MLRISMPGPIETKFCPTQKRETEQTQTLSFRANAPKGPTKPRWSFEADSAADSENLRGVAILSRPTSHESLAYRARGEGASRRSAAFCSCRAAGTRICPGCRGGRPQKLGEVWLTRVSQGSIDFLRTEQMEARHSLCHGISDCQVH